MEVSILEREPMIVVGWKTKFISILSPDANSNNVIGSLWMQTFNYDVVSKLPGSLGHPTWGVIWADPPEARRHPAELNYLAGVPFSSVPELPAGMASYHVAGGAYAMITHKGPLTGLKATIAHIHKWADDNGYTEPANWCDLELYDERFFKEGPEQAFDYLISIRPVSVPPPQVTIEPAPKLSEDTGARSHEFKRRTDKLRLSRETKPSAKKPPKKKKTEARPARRSPGEVASARDGKARAAKSRVVRKPGKGTRTKLKVAPKKLAGKSKPKKKPANRRK